MSEEEISQDDENKETKKNLGNNELKNNKNSKNNKITDSSNLAEESEPNDIISKVKKESKKVKSKVNVNNLKVFEKYHNLSIKELHILLSQKNDDLIRLNEEKEKSKKILHDLINKLNTTIAKNSNYLYYEDFDSDLILNLEQTKEDKKRELENSKKLKKLFKDQLTNLKDKISKNDKDKKKLSLIDTKIDNIKKKNIELKKEIFDIKRKKVIQDKELEIISDNIKYPLKIKLKTEDMNNFASQKHDYFEKLSMSMKSLDNILKEIKRFDEIYKSSIKEDTDENLVKKINFWINLIKSDLSGNKNEIIIKVESGKSQFLNEIKIRKETSNKGEEINNVENIAKIAKTEESPPKFSEMNYDITKGGEKIGKKKIIINKNKSTSLLYSNFKRNVNSLKRNKIPSLYINSYNGENNLDHKTLFKKLNYLKLTTPGTGTGIKLKKMNNFSSKYNGKSQFISEEINDSTEYNNNINCIESNPNPIINLNSINNLNNQEMNDILSSDYDEITNSDYRELLNKKEQYLESNLRLEKNIIEIKRTKSNKYANVLKVVYQNAENLENIKKHNSLIEKEIEKLCTVFKLTLEQAKLQNEIAKKNPNKIKYKLKSESVKNEENKLIKTTDKIPNNINLEEIFLPKKRQIKSIEINKNIKKKIKNETREEKLKKIKEKYKDEYDEINEESQIKDKENDKEEIIEKNNENIEENKENIVEMDNIDDINL